MTAQTLTLQMTAPAAARVGDVTGLRARVAPLIAGLDETVPLAGSATGGSSARPLRGRRSARCRSALLKT